MKRKPQPRALARLLKGRRSGPEAPGRPVGRPLNSGNWMSREHLETEATAAIGALKAKGKYPSQAEVAKILSCHPDTLGRAVRRHGLDWRQMVSGTPAKG